MWTVLLTMTTWYSGGLWSVKSFLSSGGLRVEGMGVNKRKSGKLGCDDLAIVYQSLSIN